MRCIEKVPSNQFNLLFVTYLLILSLSSQVTYSASVTQKAANNFFKQAVNLIEQGDLKGALDKFELGMSIDDTNLTAHYFMAETLKSFKRHKDAKAHFAKAAKLGPETEHGIMVKANLVRGWKKEVDIIARYKNEMINITGGCYQMADSQNKVCVDDFSIGKYEVTQGLWQSVMGNNPSWFKSGDKHSVEAVSWNDAQDFIEKLNDKTGQKYRLPTEAEWEYACRSGGKNEEYCGGNDVDRLAWYTKNSGSETHPVGTKGPNGLGIHDMSGNVEEWTCSVYDREYSGNEKICAAQQDALRVIRGGSWGNNTGSVRSASRTWDDPDVRGDDLGFRLAQDK